MAAEKVERRMDMFDEPEPHIVTVPPSGGDAQAESDRQLEESRRRYGALVAEKLLGLGAPADRAAAWSAAVLDVLFVIRPVEGETPCACSCHPRLPATDFHDYGFGCACHQSAEERDQILAEYEAEAGAYRESPEGKAEEARAQAEEDELVLWLAAHPGAVVTEHGGQFPEQWKGNIDGHTFYFRELGGMWRIELDLRPSGRFYSVWKGGDVDDEGSYERREGEKGDVIAEGTVTSEGYGSRPAERARFIVRAVRDHLRRQACQLHSGQVAEPGPPVGGAAFCRACGARLWG